MRKVLGLDLGTNSIGWALIEVDENNKPIRIIAMGSRIIPLSSDDRDEFQKGQAISKNQNRTIARTQRKGYNRKQLKKSDDFKFSLKKTLKELNIFPSKELMQIPSLELWKLRSEAASGSSGITGEQLGRIFYMLNQKRGYKSARSEANQDKKDTDYVAEVKGRFAKLKETKHTIGQYFYDELVIAKKENQYFRIKEKVYPREAYVEEFDAIINAQKEKHDFLTEEVVEKLRNQIIYYQRSLKSQKGLVSICEFEGFETTYIDKETKKEKKAFVGPKVAPKTSPLYQLCKIWEVVNNISLKVKNAEGSKYKWGDKFPTIEEKEKIVAHLNQKAKLDFKDLVKILGLKEQDVYVNKQIQKGIQGNITYAAIENILGESEALQFNYNVVPTKKPAILVDKKTGEVLKELEGLQIDAKIEREPLYQLWHTIYSIKDLEECKAALIKRFNFPSEIADKLSRLDFNKQAFGNKSNKAMRKILPYLMQGYDYSQACNFAGYNHSNSLTKDEQSKRLTDEKLALLPKNTLRQPIVEKIINQMINVVNAIIETYGKPDEIRVELARELKQSKDERNDADIQNSNNKKLNDEIAQRLAAHGLPVTKKYIQKYKFIFPVKDKKMKDAQVVNQCIYCGEIFNLTEALSGDDFDIDHIVPQALLFDDSQTNKVLVHRSCNANKTNKTAYDYIAAKGEDALGQYINRVDNWFKKGILSYGKMQRLKVSYIEYTERKKIKKETEADKKLWESFIDRQLRETQYIARKSRGILQQICNNVTTTEGTVTAKLRKVWGWDNVLENLQFERFKTANQTGIKTWTSQHGRRTHEKEEIQSEVWTKRDDHRHHAIDALVVACTQQGFIQRLNTLNSSIVRNEMIKEIEEAKAKHGKASQEVLSNQENTSSALYDEKNKMLDAYLSSQTPFNTKQVADYAEQILISFKAGKKVATNGVRKEKVDGKKKVVQPDIIVPRGALHEQFVYGKIKVIAKDFKTDSYRKFPIKYLFENVDRIAEPHIKIKVEQRLLEFDKDVKKAMDSIKKLPLFIDKQNTKPLLNAYCYVDEFVIKYKIREIKKEDVKYIVDEKVKRLVKERLEKFNGKEKEAFKDVLWFNEEKQIPILSVRCYTGLSNVQAIKRDENNNEIGFSIPGNNHHIAIYKDVTGNNVQHLCSFWHAVERRKYKIPYIIKDTNKLWSSLIEKELPQTFLDKLPTDNLELQFSLQQNEMFILGLALENFEQAILENNKSLLSKHLYLVWSVSDNNYWFRHHLETKNSELKTIQGAKEVKRLYNIRSLGAFFQLNPIKVRLNHLGEITKIGE
ncbi:type II CRISPR RNA-guided endonuclease Cas9 [Parasediminibacterium sp. JCM 36343]|uniref:type II CRISPR RNA-guided endonuclease Cas9 n=1 Tax=Parasediminibacterium sp. JCM 36343 TaxID=3374279 RepID=UPI00397B9D59